MSALALRAPEGAFPGTWSRTEVEALIDHLVGLLDALDGDADREDDDPAGQCDEDGVNTWRFGASTLRFGPGCEISDPGEPAHNLRPKYGLDQSAGPIDYGRAWSGEGWHW